MRNVISWKYTLQTGDSIIDKTLDIDLITYRLVNSLIIIKRFPHTASGKVQRWFGDRPN